MYLFKFNLAIFCILLAGTAHAASNLPQPVAIYNQAYQENYQPDNMQQIFKNAQHAYILLDPFQKNIAPHVAKLKQQNNQLAAYISIGTGENWRPDFIALKPFLTTKQWGEWPGEYFVSNISPQLVSIMRERIDKIKGWNFEWVEFDNMDWLDDENNKSDYSLTATRAQSINYAQNLCQYVRQNGMKCMAKNIIHNVQSFDGILYESYADDKNWWDVKAAQKFYKTGKLFIINHYNEHNCDQIYEEYKQFYGNNVSFICEDRNLKSYRHYNLLSQ